MIKHVSKYEKMRKWIVVVLSKFQGRGCKIARVNSICVVQPIIFFQYLTCHLSQLVHTLLSLYITGGGVLALSNNFKGLAKLSSCQLRSSSLRKIHPLPLEGSGWIIGVG